MRTCKNCRENLHYPSDGHTIICPSCGMLFDFQSPDTEESEPLGPKSPLPQSPLLTRAKWVAVFALLFIVGIVVYRIQTPIEEPEKTQENP